MKLEKYILSFVIIVLAAAQSAVANAIVIDFSSGLPKNVTLEDGDNGILKSQIYNHIDASTTSWTVGRLGDGHGQVALSPTRHTDPNLTSQNRLILPPIELHSDSITYLRWESRSMHKDLLEKYHVLARTEASESWDTIYTCKTENYQWTYHVLPLEIYKGKNIQIAIECASTNGFMLALDNIFLGLPSQDKPLIKVEQTGQRFIAQDDEPTISVCLTNYGSPLMSEEVALVNNGEFVATCNIPQLAYGESIDLDFDVKSIPMHEKYEYKIVALSESEDIKLFDLGWVYRSYYPRVAFIDRGSGTWCNNCPSMELTTSRLENIYGLQLIVAESHVGNDVLANPDYLNDYLNDFMRAVPALVPNHRKDRVKYSVKDTDDMSDVLLEPTIASINAEYSISGNQITINAVCEFAEDIVNENDRYTVGYMLLADYHNPDMYAYLQSNSATTNSKAQYYYMPSHILPEMMWYENVTTECSMATKGVQNSVPSRVEAHTPFTASYTTRIPDDVSIIKWKAIAYIIDNTDGHIVNASVAQECSTGSVSTVISDSSLSMDDRWYTIQGLILAERPSTPGLYIHNGKKILITK